MDLIKLDYAPPYGYTRDWRPGNEDLIPRRSKFSNLAIFFMFDPGFDRFKARRIRILKNSKNNFQGLRGSNPDCQNSNLLSKVYLRTFL